MDYDMEGLEFGEYGGLGEWINERMIKDTFVASTAGAVTLLAGTYGIDMLMRKVDFLNPADADNKRRVKGLMQIVLGVVAGGLVYRMGDGTPDTRVYETAAMGVTGGLGAVGMANILNTFLGANAVSLEALPGEASLLSAYSDDFDGVAALSALEATGVSSSPGAFAQFADPSVTNEALMGTIVQQEELGAYQPYLA